MRSDPVELAAQAPAPAPRLLGAIRALAAPATIEPVELPGFRFVSEREPGTWFCCANCSGAMVGHYAAGAPATLAEAHAIKAAAGVVHDDGMTPAELRAGMANRQGIRLQLVETSLSTIEARLLAGWALAVPLTYAELPTHLRRWAPGFGGGHTGVLAGFRGSRWGWFDPLAPSGWGGEYVEPAAILGAAWSAGIMGAAGAAARRTDVATLIRPAIADGAAGAPFYESPGGAQVGKLSTAQVVSIAGVPMDASPDHLNLGWRQVQLRTAAIDGKLADKLVYMLTTALANERPAPTPPAGGCTPAQLDAARLEGARAEFDRVNTRP